MTADLPQQAVQTSRYKLLRPPGKSGVGGVFVALDRESGELATMQRVEGYPELAYGA